MLDDASADPAFLVPNARLTLDLLAERGIYPTLPPPRSLDSTPAGSTGSRLRP